MIWIIPTFLTSLWLLFMFLALTSSDRSGGGMAALFIGAPLGVGVILVWTSYFALCSFTGLV